MIQNPLLHKVCASSLHTTPSVAKADRSCLQLHSAPTNKATKPFIINVSKPAEILANEQPNPTPFGYGTSFFARQIAKDVREFSYISAKALHPVALQAPLSAVLTFEKQYMTSNHEVWDHPGGAGFHLRRFFFKTTEFWNSSASYKQSLDSLAPCTPCKRCHHGGHGLDPPCESFTDVVFASLALASDMPSADHFKEQAHLFKTS